MREKPVVVSMGEVAASGGYYVAAAADVIFAEVATLTGSIGVVGGKINLEGLYRRLGVAKEVVERGARAGLYSEARGFSHDERAAVERAMEAIYATFLARVARGRALSPEDVQRVAEGRIWSGRRALLGAGWGGIGQQDLPPSVHAIDYAPYGWLFPRMRAIVHHGGSGTTAQGLRAGVPAVIVPFLFDQFYWGRRLYALGVGPPPIPFKKLSAERLAVAISTAISHASMRQRSADLAAKVRAEDGIGQATEIIEQHIRQAADHS